MSDYDEIDSEYSEDEFQDGSSARKQFAKVVEEDVDVKASSKQNKLRFRRALGLPGSITNAKVVDSISNQFGAERSTDSNAECSSSSQESDSDDASLFYDENNITSKNAVSRDTLHIEDEGDSGYPFSSSLLESQWKLAEESKNHLKLIQQKDDEERRLRKIKANCAKTQMCLWETCVGVRIHLEKILDLTNRLPPPPAFQLLMEGFEDFHRHHCNQSIIKLMILLKKIQIGLIRQNSSVSEHIRSQAQDDADLHDAAASKKRLRGVEQSWKSIDKTPKRIKHWAIEIADQWEAKTSLKVQQKFKILDQTIESQIERAMQNDLPRLKQKSYASWMSDRAKVIGCELLDVPEDMTINTQNLNDKEFYISLLRDVVQQNKSNLDLQNASDHLDALLKKTRNNKDSTQKRDPRASKGRRIRFVPIPKLLNFMTAEPVKYGSSTLGTSTDEKYIDQLINSLFQNLKM